jgi:type IV pilus assembly protein PilF
MRTMFHVTGLLFLLIVSGCATKTERTDLDHEKIAVANTKLGVAYLAQGKYKNAMFKLKKALEYDSDNGNAHHYIAELYRRLEQNDLADEHFRRAMELNEEDSAIKNNFGIFLCGVGSYKEGIMLLNKVLADPLYSDKGQVYENMGLCAEKQGNVQHAGKYFETALKFNKRLPAALLGLAQINFDKGKIKTASDYLKRYHKIAKPTSKSLWLELLIARKKGLKGRAGSLAIKLKQYFPDSQETKLLRKLNLR